MGASTSWLAIKGKPRTKILEELALQICEPPEPRGSGLQGSDFRDGWYVIAARGYGHPLTKDTVLQRLSGGCEVIAGGVEDHVMCSTACSWKDGREVWSVDHDSEKGVMNLSTRGQMPSVFRGIYEKLLAKQNAEGGPESRVDFIFNAPSDVVAVITGYDYAADGSDEVWHVLTSTRAKKSWLWSLFGR